MLARLSNNLAAKVTETMSAKRAVRSPIAIPIFSFVAALLASVAFTSVVQAQNAKDIDVVGLKLGMTVPNASAILKAYNPSIKLTQLYATDDQAMLTMWGNNGFSPETQKPQLDKAKLKFPIALVGVIAMPGSAKEYYNLRFTPSDEGGSMYAVARNVIYTTAGETPVEFAAKLIAKYGKPTSASNGQIQLYWHYDASGRILSEKSREAFQCQSHLQLQTGYNSPDFANMGVYAGQGPGFRHCGVQLEAESNYNGTSINGFYIALSDQNAMGYDNGIQSYLEGKIAAAGLAPKKSTAPGL